MTKYITTTIGRLRLLAFLEGISLLALVFIAMPVKYGYGDPSLVKSIGPVHGALFVLFVIGALRVSADQKWKIRDTIRIILLSSFVPFGTFYIDAKIFRGMQAAVQA